MDSETCYRWTKSTTLVTGGDKMNLIRKTIKAQLKFHNIRIEKDGMIYKDSICIFCMPLSYTENDLYLFLEGYDRGIEIKN